MKRQAHHLGSALTFEASDTLQLIICLAVFVDHTDWFIVCPTGKVGARAIYAGQVRMIKKTHGKR